MRQYTVPIALVVALAVAGQAAATDWTAWRGPAANGISPETSWNAKSLAPSNVLWKTNVGKGHSAVAVKGDRLYTMGQRDRGRGESMTREDVVYCLDASSGRELWSYAYPVEARDWPGPGSTPVVDGDRLYTVSRPGEVYCFEAETGKVLWRKNLVGENLAREPQWGFCGSATVDGDVVLLNAGRSGLALDKRTGRVVWSSEPVAGYLATPVVFERDGKRVAAISAAGTLYVVDVGDGSVQWSHPWQTDADPTVLGDRVMLMGAGRGRGSTMPEIAGAEPEGVWESDALSGSFQTAVVVDGHAYGFGRERRDHALQCVDMASGEVRWSQNMGEWGAVIAADGKLIILEGDGDLVIAEASPKAFTEIARARVLEMRHWRSYPHDEPKTCWTYPVISGGRVFARDTWGDLVCVDLNS